MAGSWASWSVLLAGACLVVAGALLPFLPRTPRAFLVEDAFEGPGLVLAALGAPAGRQRLWPLGAAGALLVLAVDVAWRFAAGGPSFHIAWMVGAVLFAAWACWPMRGGRLPLAIAQAVLAAVTMAWIVHGTFLALGDPLWTTAFVGAGLLIAMGAALALRGGALRRAGSPTLL